MSLLTNVLKLWRTGQYLLPADSGFSPKHLFAGRVGWWLDPLDFRYAWQDSAGTTPYTAVEQYVGKIVDKSPNALAFTQATSAARPVVSARVNMISNTETMTGWLGTGAAVSISGATPWGSTEFKLTEDYSTGVHWARYSYFPVVAGPTYTTNIIARSSGRNKVGYQPTNYFGASSVIVDLTTLSIVSSSAGLTNITITDIGSGWVKCSSGTNKGVSGFGGELIVATITSDYSYSGDGVSGIYFAEPSVCFASRSHLPFQSVTSSSVYNTVGFPHYLKFDGAATNLVGPSGGGASTAFYFGAAVQFGKVGAVQNIVSDAGTNTGFKIRTTAANQIEISAGNGSAFTAVNTTETFAAGDVAFIELFDNGTNLSACLGNGTPATVARPAVSAGTAQMTLGKANNAASEYSGVSIFSAVYLKDYCPTAAERADYKRWALQRAGVAS